MSVERSTPSVLVDFAWYEDGRGLLGKVPKVKLPELVSVVEEYTAGGMSAPVDIVMGMVEKLEMSITMAEPLVSTIKLFGLSQGQEKSFTFRGALQGKTGVEALVVRAQGLVTKLSFDDPERKKILNTECTLSLASLKIERGKEVLVDIDAEAGTFIVGGVDLRADVNKALGF